MIKWDSKYELGIPHIDEQHQKLFQIADEAFRTLRDPFLVDKYDKVVNVIEELQEYAVYHFRAEEQYMQETRYPRFLSHKVEHDDFIKEVCNINLRAVDEDPEGYLVNILDFVVGWISNHILNSDLKIAGK